MKRTQEVVKFSPRIVGLNRRIHQIIVEILLPGALKPLNLLPRSANQSEPAVTFDRLRCDPYSFNKKPH
jgi:hypothetical protein